MYQQEIQFFFPLTEQIQLDLDYSNCAKSNDNTGIYVYLWGAGGAGGTGTTWTTSSFRMQENETTMVVLKKPNLLRKLLFKLLGFKWEIK